jgi:hypothetical protein
MPLAKISTATAASSNPMIRITTLMSIFPSRRPIWVAALSAIQVVSATSRQHATTAARWAREGRCARAGAWPAGYRRAGFACEG